MSDFCRQCGAPLTSFDKCCPNCGFEVVEADGFCRQCGAPLTGFDKSCPNCGLEVVEAHSFCRQCGKPLTSFDKSCPACGCNVQNPQIVQRQQARQNLRSSNSQNRALYNQNRFEYQPEFVSSGLINDENQEMFVVCLLLGVLSAVLSFIALGFSHDGFSIQKNIPNAEAMFSLFGLYYWWAPIVLVLTVYEAYTKENLRIMYVPIGIQLVYMLVFMASDNRVVNADFCLSTVALFVLFVIAMKTYDGKALYYGSLIICVVEIIMLATKSESSFAIFSGDYYYVSVSSFVRYLAIAFVYGCFGKMMMNAQ